MNINISKLLENHNIEELDTKIEMASLIRTSQTAIDRLLDSENISITLNMIEKGAFVLGNKLSIRLT